MKISTEGEVLSEFTSTAIQRLLSLENFQMGIQLSALCLLIVVSPTRVEAGDIASACEKVKLPNLKLKYRSKDENIEKIKKSTLETGATGSYLRSIYSTSPFPERESDLIRLANVGNIRTLPESPRKKVFLRFSNSSERIKFPKDYVTSVLEQAKAASPWFRSQVDQYLGFSNFRIKSSIIRSANENETGFYGAVYSSVALPNEKKISREIVISNNASEPIPYLIPLLMHELVHAKSFAEMASAESDKEFFEWRIIDEAKGFETQIDSYLKLVKSDPDLFCNWLYVTWSYGDIVIPLGWAMASMEDEMRSGEFIDRYAQTGHFEGKSFMLGKDKKLRPDLRTKIRSLNLRYVH